MQDLNRLFMFHLHFNYFFFYLKTPLKKLYENTESIYIFLDIVHKIALLTHVPTKTKLPNPFFKQNFNDKS